MSWLLFLDESGHDHQQMPYEVRGGIALQDRRVWPFVRAMASLEENCFGVRLADFKKEFKGSKLLDKDRVKWADQAAPQGDEERKRNARAFLSKGLQKQPQTRDEFTGYGQACMELARGMFRLLRDHDAKLFASVIPRGVRPPETFEAQEFLRKDHVFLLERFYYFVRLKQEHGLIVMDQVEEQNDIRFVRKLERYFVKTTKGTQRADWIVPAPLFSSSYLSVPIQVADSCIYCLNWGYRRPGLGMDAPTRTRIEQEFAGWIQRLEYRQQTKRADDRPRTLHGIVFVPNPYGSGRDKSS
ncbi:MAG: DUF3800 domain-containing protein [Pirellulaceae bacterium]